MSSLSATQPSAPPLDPSDHNPPPNQPGLISAEAAQQIVIALMFPSMLMPIAGSMSRVALPIIRDDFSISADMTAWITTAYILPFMILMPVYGRLSDGVGRRRLLLAGMLIFAIGTVITITTTELVWLMIGRAIQGVGTAGITPLGMAIISTIFRAEERGKALGTWSSIGPTTAAISPPVAGLLVDWGGWRYAYAPPLLLVIIAIFVVVKFVPAGLSNIQPKFWRSFDWTGVLLLASTLTALLFYLSSRPITGVAPLQDWRLLGGVLFFLVAFLWWEQRCSNPFVVLGIFANRMFTAASCSAALRMMTMGGSSFLIPLFLADIYALNASLMGFILMIMPGAMMLTVRFGGQMADRFGSRFPVIGGFLSQLISMILFSLVNLETPLWMIGALLAVHGLGVGLMLAALHQAAMHNMEDAEMGVAAGLYSMIRFVGMAIGTALSGVLLQNYLNQSLPLIEAYQSTFLFFAGSALCGLALAAVGLRKNVAVEALV